MFDALSPLVRKVALVVATSALALSTAVTPASGAPGYGRAELQRDLDAIRETGVVGVQAQVTTDRRRIHARSGTAVLGTPRPVPYGGHFRIGSNTKTFIATVILQLTAEKRLSLEDPVDRWLPGVVRGNGNDGRRITVRQLLQHTSGLPNYTDGMAKDFLDERAFLQQRHRTYTPAGLVALALRHEPLFPPGSGHSYSNTNFLLAGMIVERVTGESWRSQVHRRIIAPLGMRHTSTPGLAASLPSPHAEGYTREKATGRLFNSTEHYPSWAESAGEMISTTEDLTTFWRALLGHRLLPPAQLRTMLTTVPADRPGEEAGLGIFRHRLSCGGWYYAHSGGTPGYITNNGVTADGRVSVVISSSTLTEHQDARAEAAVDHALCALRGGADRAGG
ncbi:serine hydrolase domain-containing protein [Streptomyces sp. NPDC049837]|uniref:serine hydrolase domain-containing protein n=1 Tax=Streptomyces sp. NPDC049837 TaxID=3155277 RepID=UPI0034265FDB